MHNLASNCSLKFQLRNCMEEYAEADTSLLERYIEQWGLNRPDLVVTLLEKKQLVGSMSLYTERSPVIPPSYDDLEKDLNDIRK